MKMSDHMKCSYCEEIICAKENDYVLDVHGEVYCEDCKEECLSWCRRCNNFVHKDKIVHIDDLDQDWCNDCASSHAYKCSHCRSWNYTNFGDRNTVLCGDCLERHYFFCAGCDQIYHNDRAYCDGDVVYCMCCHDERGTNIHEYSYSPTPKFYAALDDENKPAYLGFELEAGGVSIDVRNAIAKSISDDEETFYLKKDSSIPEHGFELVSHPITLKWHKKLDWENILNSMSKSGMKSHNLGEKSCGLHVHVSKNYLSSYKWLLIDWFVSKYQAQFELIARRKESHWACFKKSNGQKIKDVFGKSKNRYQVVNFENPNTVEFRLFRGTLKYSTFMATLEIVDALVHWANQLSISNILSTGDAFKVFTDFIQSNPLYSNAAKYLKDKALI